LEADRQFGYRGQRRPKEKQNRGCASWERPSLHTRTSPRSQDSGAKEDLEDIEAAEAAEVTKALAVVACLAYLS
jgi:hypothetical protein